MKKIKILLVLVLSMIVLTACMPTEKPPVVNEPPIEVTPEKGNITFRLAEAGDVGNINGNNTKLSLRSNSYSFGLMSRLNTTPQKQLLTGDTPQKQFLIGDNPSLYFEYNRPGDFTFIEAMVEDSIEPNKTFKVDNALANLDGYSIIRGHFNQDGVSYFRAIITLPEIRDLGEQRYALVNIKILIDGEEFIENIEPIEEEEENFSVTFRVLVDDHFSPILDEIDSFINDKIIRENRPYFGYDEAGYAVIAAGFIHIADYSDLKEYLGYKVRYDFEYSINVDDKHQDYAGQYLDHQNVLYFNIIGDFDLTLHISIEIEGEVREYTREYEYRLNDYNIEEESQMGYTFNFDAPKYKMIHFWIFNETNYDIYMTSSIGGVNIEELVFYAFGKNENIFNLIFIDYSDEFLGTLSITDAIKMNNGNLKVNIMDLNEDIKFTYSNEPITE